MTSNIWLNIDTIITLALLVIFIAAMVFMAIYVLVNGNNLDSEIPSLSSKYSFFSLTEKLLSAMQFDEDEDEGTNPPNNAYFNKETREHLKKYNLSSNKNKELLGKKSLLLMEVKLLDYYKDAYLGTDTFFLIKGIRILIYRFYHMLYKIKKRRFNANLSSRRNAYVNRARVASFLHVCTAVVLIYILSKYGVSLFVDQQMLFSALTFLIPYLLYHYYMDHLFWIRAWWKTNFIRLRLWTLTAYMFSYIISIYFYNPVMIRIELCFFILSLILYLAVPLIIYLKFAVYGKKHNKILYGMLMLLSLAVISYLIYIWGNGTIRFLQNTVNYSYLRQ